MKHSIFEPGIQESLFKRIDSLKAGTRGSWGKLSAVQMIRHLSESGLMAFGEIAMPDRSTFMTRTIIKWIFLNNIKPPGREKGKIKTFPEVDVVERKIAVEDIALEKIKYKTTINRIINTPVLHPVHTVFGKMSRADWGHLTYAHADYHLTQFNS